MFEAVDNNVWRHSSVPRFVFIGCHKHNFVLFYFQRPLWQIFANRWRHCIDTEQHRDNLEVSVYSIDFGICYSFFLFLSIFFPFFLSFFLSFLLSFFLSEAYFFYVFIVVSRGLFCTWSLSVTHTHTHTPHSVGLPWTSDQPEAENSTWQQTTLTRDKRSWTWRDSNLKSQEATYAFDSSSSGIGISVAALRSVLVSANCADALKSRKERGKVEEAK